MQELLRQMAETLVKEIMSAEADQMCEAAGNSRNVNLNQVHRHAADM
jgi:transposase-like protein